MTREKEIRQYLKERNIPITSLEANSIIEGAKWADRTLIEKACDWIQMDAMKYVNSIGGCMYFDVINSTKDFKKAMEL